MYKNRIYSTEAEVTHLFAEINIGASGAVSSSSGAGIASVVKGTPAGEYEIELSDKFYKILHISPIVVDDANSAVVSIEIKEVPTSLQSDFRADKKFKIQCYDAASTEVNPASGSQIKVHIMVRRTEIDA